MSPEQESANDPFDEQVKRLESLSGYEMIFRIAIHDTFEFALSKAYEDFGPPGSTGYSDKLEVSLEITFCQLKQRMTKQFQARFGNSAIAQLEVYDPERIDRQDLSDEFIAVLDNVPILEEAVHSQFRDEITDED